MESHPSLKAPLIELRSISPVKTMEPYELCWCHSGKKYKWCHYKREEQAPVNIFEVEAEIHAQFRAGYCSYPDPAGDTCSPTITKAHTVQKKGGLAAIAEAGHVLTIKPTMKDLIKTNGKILPRKVGINLASVFPGFCSTHDDAVFKPIEGKALSLTHDTAFLFSYRAIAYERFAKEAQLKAIECQRDADKGRSFAFQAQIQESISALIDGINLGLNDANTWKQKYDARLLSGGRNDFYFVAARFDQTLPIVACCAFAPEFDFQGNPVQNLIRGTDALDHITLTVTTFEKQTIVVFGWVGDQSGPASILANSFLAVENHRKADALIRLLFIHTDNLFLKISWWNSLNETDQNELNQMTLSGTPDKGRSGFELSNDRRALVCAEILETASY